MTLMKGVQLTALGVPRSTVARSDELGGMFTRVLPGVHRIDGRSPLTAVLPLMVMSSTSKISVACKTHT